METLTEIWQRLPDKSDKFSVHSYGEVYEKLLAPYRHTALNVLEIGCFNGASIRMWAEYFTQAKINGIDCSVTPHDGMADLKPLQQDILNSKPYDRLFNTHIHIFNAEDVTEVSRRFFGTKFDVIIEDAGHDIEQQLNIFVIFNQYLSNGGIYIIEDIQDIDKHSYIFKSDPGWQVLDRRSIKNRYDDVIAIYRK